MRNFAIAGLIFTVLLLLGQWSDNQLERDSVEAASSELRMKSATYAAR